MTTSSNKLLKWTLVLYWRQGGDDSLSEHKMGFKRASRGSWNRLTRSVMFKDLSDSKGPASQKRKTGKLWDLSLTFQKSHLHTSQHLLCLILPLSRPLRHQKDKGNISVSKMGRVSQQEHSPSMWPVPLGNEDPQTFSLQNRWLRVKWWNRSVNKESHSASIHIYSST